MRGLRVSRVPAARGDAVPTQSPHDMCVSSCGSNDIALMKLRHNAVLNNQVQTGQLPPAGTILPDGYPCYLSGWGRLSSASPQHGDSTRLLPGVGGGRVRDGEMEERRDGWRKEGMRGDTGMGKWREGWRDGRGEGWDGGKDMGGRDGGSLEGLLDDGWMTDRCLDAWMDGWWDGWKNG